MAITQDDCITAHRTKKKRKAPTGPSGVQPHGIVWCIIQFPRPHRETLQQADGFSGHPSSKEPLELLCLNNNNLGQDQIINNPTMRIVTTDASLVEVLITSPGLVPEIRSLPKIKTRRRTTRARAKSKLCKCDKE